MTENVYGGTALQAKKTALPRIAVYGLLLPLMGVLAVLAAAYGTRKGWWHFRIGLFIFKSGGYACIFGGAVALIGYILSRMRGSKLGAVLSLTGLIIILPVVGTVWYWKTRAEAVPAIHDITTDTEDPPSFNAILPLRKDAPNPSEYGGPEVAKQQRAAYPSVGPAILPIIPDAAFQKTLTAAMDSGWEIVAASQAEGRIEATDTTYWFGFKDDIVIRIRPVKDGSRIDVRSVSRVGKSDAGTNERRIRRFLERLV